MNRKELLNALNPKTGQSPQSAMDVFDELALQGLRQAKRPADLEAVGRRLDQKLNQRYGGTSLLRTLRPMLAVAAAILILLVSWGLFQFEFDAASAATAFRVDPQQPLPTMALGLERDIATPSTDDLRTALTAYEAGDFPLAASYLSTFVEQHPEMHAAKLFLGHALVAEQPLQAIPVLQSCLDNPSLDQNYQDYAQWFLAWAYLNAGQAQRAQALLTNLAANEASVCAEDAQQLLNQRFSGE